MDDPVRVLLPCPQPQTDRDVLLNFVINYTVVPFVLL